jgi:hypothetical protein
MTKHLKIRFKSLRNQLVVFGIVFGGMLLVPPPCVQANWPGFRGPSGLGYTTEENLPTTWGGPAKENVRWAALLVGQGHASPIVWNHAVIVCTVNWPADAADRKKVIPEHHVTCYRASDGELLWDTLVPPGPWLRNDFRSGRAGYAAATPVTDGSHLPCVRLLGPGGY